MYSFRSASFTRNEEKMKKSILYPIVGAAALIAAFLYYYVTLPAINIHSSGFWFFLMGAVVAVMLIYMIRKTGKGIASSGLDSVRLSLSEYPLLKWLGILLLVILAVYGIGTLLSGQVVFSPVYMVVLIIMFCIFYFCNIPLGLGA